MTTPDSGAGGRSAGSTMNPPGSDEVRRALLGTAWFREVLDAAAALELPHWWVAAGAVRDAVWDARYGLGEHPPRDVDVIWFDPRAERDADGEAELRLGARLPEVRWDVKNQAHVHRWYPARFGLEVEPFQSTLDAVATFPEPASCVAVRLDGHGEFVVAAPHGLDDLLAGIWRHNPQRATFQHFADRVARKRPAERWPAVRVLGLD